MIFLGTTAILSVFAFLFLIPFVVDPAISTIVADYDPVPVTCIVTEHTRGEGLRNCSWSSCREGCTSGPIRYVNLNAKILFDYSFSEFNEFSVFRIKIIFFVWIKIFWVGV